MVITGETRLIGIFGDPVAHSLSPRMHNAAYGAMGLDLCYVPLHVRPDDLEAGVKGLRAMRFLGANVTVPHKVAILSLMDELAESAIRVGAVNTIVNKDGVLTGHNTDGAGFIRSLEEVTKPDYPNAPVVIFGAGGAARSIAVALAAEGVKHISIINRTTVRAEELKGILERGFPHIHAEIVPFDQDASDAISACKIAINATSLGLEADLKTAPAWVDRLTKDHVVCDIVYRAQEKNPLLVAARKKGATTLGGLGMLLHQGAISIHLWTGEEPPVDVMRSSIEP